MDWLTNNIFKPAQNWFQNDKVGKVFGGIGDFLQQVGKGATSVLKHVPGVGEIVDAVSPITDTISKGWDALQGRGNGPSFDDLHHSVNAVGRTQAAYQKNAPIIKQNISQAKQNFSNISKRMRVA